MLTEDLFCSFVPCVCGLCGCACVAVIISFTTRLSLFSVMKGALYFMTSSESRWEEKTVLHVGCVQGNHSLLLCVIGSRGAARLMFEIKNERRS